MPLRTSRLRHRLQFAAAILGTVGAVYGFSRIIKPKPQPILTPPQLINYVPPTAPPILPRVDPPLIAQPPQPKVSPAFMTAVGEGDIGAMEKLYEKNMPLDGTLQTAAATGNKTTVVWLLEHGANVNENEDETEAPVLAADSHPAIVKLLLDKGANEPSISVAAMAGAPNAVSRLLAKSGVVINPKDGSSGPLFDALNSSLATPQNRKIIVDKLLAAGADPNLGDGTTTPVGAAIGSCEVPDEDGSTPPCALLIRALASRGAKVGGDVLATAIDLGDPLRAPVLDATLSARLEPGATASALSQATGERDAAVVKKLSAKGIAWNWHDGEADGAAPLVSAIDNLDVPLVRAMLDVGAPADLHLKDGRSPLGLALDKVAGDTGDAARIVELLVAHGAGVNRRLPDGRTPLFAAAEAGDIRVINAMLDHGARVNEVILDETALDAAERSGHIPVARILHARGARRAKPADSTL
jgi:ankyrin repeat protein